MLNQRIGEGFINSEKWTLYGDIFLSTGRFGSGWGSPRRFGIELADSLSPGISYINKLESIDGYAKKLNAN